MRNHKVGNDALDGLASRIAACIADADAIGFAVVAAHLNAALISLTGYGLEASGAVPGAHKQLN